MEKARLPWNLGTVEQAVAMRLTEFDIDYVREASRSLEKENGVMRAALEEVGFHLDTPSDSFFYFADMAEYGADAAKTVELMLKERIMVRDCSSFGPEFKTYIRFCVKDRERNDRFAEAMGKTLKALGY